MRDLTTTQFLEHLEQPFAFPGGYEKFFITSDGATLCHKCAKEEQEQILDSIETKTNDGWQIVAVDLSCNLDESTACDHCNETIDY